MTIGIISDTHDHVKNIQKAIDFLNTKNISLVYHCGDWVAPFTFEFFFNACQPKFQVKSVLGNNEGDRFRLIQRLAKSNFPLTLEQHVLEDTIEGKKIALYHGQDKAIASSLITCGSYDAVFTGHTHIPLIETIGHTLHVNPGTVSDAARSQIIDAPTLALYQTDTNQAEIIEFLKEAK